MTGRGGPPRPDVVDPLDGAAVEPAELPVGVCGGMLDGSCDADERELKTDLLSFGGVGLDSLLSPDAVHAAVTRTPHAAANEANVLVRPTVRILPDRQGESQTSGQVVDNLALVHKRHGLTRPRPRRRPTLEQ